MTHVTECTNNKKELVGKKVAVIVVGDNQAGKTRTINTLKPMLDRLDKTPSQKMTENDNSFTLDDGTGNGSYIFGWMYSQSLQEKWLEELSIISSKIDGNKEYGILVLASRHEDDEDSYFLRLTDIIDFLDRRGFKVYTTTIVEHTDETDELYGIDSDTYYQQKAHELYEFVLQAKMP